MTVNTPSTILVIGAGVMGLQTAIALKERGYTVLVFDRSPTLPAPDASSTDINKAVRMDYGRQDVYTDLAYQSILKWRDLQQNFFPKYFDEKVLILS